ncbi:MAG: hypothetical protein ABIS03_13205 [Gemmatimonadaceae bacterium]
MLLIREVMYCKPGKVRPLKIMEGYHDLVVRGCREIFKIEERKAPTA